MKFQGMDVSREDLMEFQKVFPNSRAAEVLAMLVMSLKKDQIDVLKTLGVAEARFREAQGALNALETLELLGSQLAEMSLEDEDDTETIEEDEDVGPVYP